MSLQEQDPRMGKDKKEGGGGNEDEQQQQVKQVKIDNETHRLLTRLGEFGETYGDIVKRVAKHYSKCAEAAKETRERRKQQSDNGDSNNNTT